VIWEFELDFLRGIASVHLANEVAFFRLLNPANPNNQTKTIQSKAAALYHWYLLPQWQRFIQSYRRRPYQ
jgi:hypothetical protein